MAASGVTTLGLLMLGSVLLYHPGAAFDCATLSQSASYVPSNFTCCQNVMFSILLPNCCTKSTTECLCNPYFNYGSSVCILKAAPTTAAPAPSVPTTIAPALVNVTAAVTSAPVVTTTASTVPLCPIPTTTARLLDSVLPRTACLGSGTVGFESIETKESLCNGALVLNQTTGRYDVYTVSSCVNEISVRFGNGQSVAFVVGDERIPLDPCSIKDFRNLDPLASIQLSALAEYLMRSETVGCPDAGCVYNRTSMRTAIRWSECYIASFGATFPGNETGGLLTTVQVEVSDISPCLPAPSGVQCFTPISKGSACVDLGDDGAPLYCTLSTGEHVLYGLAYVSTCVTGDSFFSVYPLQSAVVTVAAPTPAPTPFLP